MTPDQYCQEQAARSGSSFYYSFLFLEPQERRDITALYAFCRAVDDAVDEPGDPAVARARLDWWREELGRLYAGSPQHPVSRALVPAIERCDLAQESFTEIIDGMEMDLDHAGYADFHELALYLHRAAGVVGMLSAEIFGYQDRQTLKYAHTLGLAFQLTNIIRDVGEDARRGRIYLPRDELERFGVPERDVLETRHSAAFERLMAFQLARAQEHYQRAEALLPEADRWRQRAGLVMAAIYRATLDEIAADGFHVLDRRIALTPLRKFWLAWRTLRRERRRHRRWRKTRAAA